MLTKIVHSHHFVLILTLTVIRWQHDNGTLIEAAAARDANYFLPHDTLRESKSSSSSSLFASYWCDEDHVDFVQNIPGYVPVVPPSCWYSGYLTYEFLGRTIHTHYTLQIAEFMNSNDEFDHDVDSYNPLQKPLIYWSNGGPGASSMFGLLTELGNLLFSDNSLKTDEYRATGIPTPIYNPNSWTRLGHLLSFDQPAPIGFSYCGNDGPNNITHPHSCDGIVWDDSLTAQNAHHAMIAFYNKFPLFYDVDLYLTGESYAGIYIPTLAREIVRSNINHTAPPAKSMKLRGFAVGDGCLGTETDICGVLNPESGFDVWNVIFLAGHGQIPMSTFSLVMNACYHPHRDGDNDFASMYLRSLQQDVNVDGTLSPMSCEDAMKIMDDQTGGVYAYGLYDDCTYSNGIKRTGQHIAERIHGGVNDYACGGDIVMADYLNRPDVREAFHVEKTDFFSVDNAEGDFDYTPSEPDLTGFYKEINGKLRILIYNGDTDPAINSFAAQNWTSHLGFKEIESWRPWTVDGCRRMGGYVTRYEGNFDFLTIRGAGHMVPTNKAEAAFAFMRSWIYNEEYASYDKDCLNPNLYT